MAIRCGGNGDVGEEDRPSPPVGASKVEAEDVWSVGKGRLDFALRSGTRETDTRTLLRSLAATTSRPPTRGVGVGSGSPSQLVPRFGEAEIESERANDCRCAACVSPCDIGKFSEDGAGDLLTSPFIQLLRWKLVGRAGASAATGVKGRLELFVPEFGGRSPVRIRGGRFGMLGMDAVDADAAGGSEKNRFGPVVARVEGPGDAEPVKEGVRGCGAAMVAETEVGRGAVRASEKTPSTTVAAAEDASPFRVYWYEPANAWHAVVSGESRACRDWDGAAPRALMSAIAAACGEGGRLLETVEGC